MKEMKGTILALLAAIVSGFAIPANKVFVVTADPLVFTAVRAVIIGAIFLVISLWMAKRNKTKLFTAPKKYLAAIAVIGGAAAFYLYFYGLKLTTAGHAAFLHKTLPLYTAVLAFIFLRERLSRKYLIAMGLMIAGTAGIYFATLNPTELFSNPQLGDLLIITAAFLWAIENIIAKKAMSEANNFLVSFSRMFFGGLILFGAIILLGKADALMALTNGQLVNIGISTALLFCYVLFYYWALKMINVSKAAVLLLVAPVISLVVGIALLGEPAPTIQLAGSGVILIGAYLAAGVKSEERGI
jgi:drug/metabolite transporter (DMT)-like permease